MFERPQRGERAVLVHIEFKYHFEASDPTEFRELAHAAGADVVAFIQGGRDHPDPKYFIGRGKLEEIAQAIAAECAELVILNHPLSPAQERNLERTLNCRILGRTGLILDIFAQRARTFEGKLQVELAQLAHLSTRLIRGWTHLERQKGGIGLRGPGETQLESDRRLVRDRMKHIQQRLDKVKTQRQQGRKARQRHAIPTVALVGYTNVGKSTLFNALTAADALVANQLFATLDPTLRVITPPGMGKVVLADTVGFVSHLPHTLVAAFKATLEEVKEASLLLHVVDAQASDSVDNMKAVNAVLKDIGAEEVPQLLVYNKADLAADMVARIGDYEVSTAERPGRVWVSALNQAGLTGLLEAITLALNEQWIAGALNLPPSAGKIRAKFYQLDAVQAEDILPDGGWQLKFRLPLEQWEALARTWPVLNQHFLKDNQ